MKLIKQKEGALSFDTKEPVRIVLNWKNNLMEVWVGKMGNKPERVYVIDIEEQKTK